MVSMEGRPYCPFGQYVLLFINHLVNISSISPGGCAAVTPD
jgi:hypothetical protein